MRTAATRHAALLIGSSLAAACGPTAQGGPGEGAIEIYAYGEAFIEEGIPEAAVSDGWALSFASFEVSLRDVVVGGEALAVVDTVDLTDPSGEQGQRLGQVSVAAGRHSGAAFTISKLRVVGSATKGLDRKMLDWTFDEPVQYSACETTTRLEAGGETTFQITLHADHLLYDSLVSSQPTLAFQPLADADADMDGRITRQELEVRDIGGFDPGNDDEIDDLWSWLEALSATLGHVDGEGHCRTRTNAT